MTRSELAAELSKSESTIKGHLSQLKAIGRLRRIGSAKGGHWEVVGKNDSQPSRAG